jgi:hypothetical protein
MKMIQSEVFFEKICHILKNVITLEVFQHEYGESNDQYFCDFES